jgi:hypothetical protein
VPPESLIVRRIRQDDQFNALSLGDAAHAPLKKFLRKHAWRYERCSVARTHVLVDEQNHDSGGRVWGYVTLCASEVATTIQNQPKNVEHWPPGFSVPSIKLARMAIDTELQGKGKGTALLDFVIALVNNHVAPHVGCRLLITDAKKSAVPFYPGGHPKCLTRGGVKMPHLTR